MAGYWPSSLFALTKLRSIKTQKKITRPIVFCYLDRASVVNKEFIIWHSM